MKNHDLTFIHTHNFCLEMWPSFLAWMLGCVLCFFQVIFLTMSFEIRPLAALYPPISFFLDRFIRKGRKCRRHEHTAPATTESGYRDRSLKHFFCMWGEGGNAAKGLISRDINMFLMSQFKRYFYTKYLFFTHASRQ